MPVLLQARTKSLLLSIRNVYETLAVSAPTVVDAYRRRLTPDACNERLEAWSSRVIRNLELVLTVRGRDNMAPGRTYVIMSNHQSHYDVAVLYYVLGGNVRMVAKKELFDLPLFGRAIREAGMVSVDRGNRAKAIASLAGAKDHVAQGTHLWIAPEGKRSPTGELLPFKKGGFYIALDMRTAILPITIKGTREALRAKGMRSRAGVEVDVDIHPPIDPATYQGMDRKSVRDALMADVRKAIASAL